MKIERETGKEHKDYEFPLDESEIKSILEKLPSEDLEGLEKIVITKPLKNEDYKNYGRYVPLPGKKGRILLFLHQKVDGNFIVVLGDKGTQSFTLDEFKHREYQAVLHEVGHHVGFKDHDDISETFANDYMSEMYSKYFRKLFE